MAVVNFYLKDKNAKTETLIYLFFSFGGQRLKYSTGEKIKPNLWLEDKQRVKPQASGSIQINKWLNTLEENILEVYREARNKGEVITVEYVRSKLHQFRPNISTSSFLDRFTEFIEASVSTKSEGRIKAYKTTIDHVRKFAQNTHYTLLFETANQEFCDRFTKYLRDTISPTPTDNTLGKHISILKTFLAYGLERDWHSKEDFRKWKIESNPGNKPALTREEIIALRDFDMSNNVRLEQVRDVFVFACYTGLRWSDLEQLRPEHFQNDHINFTSIKTRKVQHIPLTKVTTAILEKYNYLLPLISAQNYNDYLKELGKLVGLTRRYEKIQYKNGKRVGETSEIWELLTSHIGRSTFCTLAQEAGMPIMHVMKVTAHSKSTTVQDYSRSSDKALQTSYNEFVDFIETSK
jgi:site-specific recombinase XerD